MSVVAPPEPPRPDELEALIREARTRQRQRRLGLAAFMAVLLGAGIGAYAVSSGSNQGVAPTRARQPRAVPSASTRCGVSLRGGRILRNGRTVFRDRPATPMSEEIRCSGATVWVVFINGIGTNVEQYVGVRSADGGRTWRVAFGKYGSKAKPNLGPELGIWMLNGPRAAYFIGWCGPCGLGTASLAVTTDGGRTFRSYSVPLPSGFAPTRLGVSGTLVKIWARRLTPKSNYKKYAHKTVTVRVA